MPAKKAAAKKGAAKKAAAKKGAAKKRQAKRTQQGRAGGGSKPTFSKDEIRAAMKAAGGCYSAAAEMLGVNKSTVWKAVNRRWPDLIKDRQAAIATVTNIAETNVVEGVINGDSGMTKFWLQTQAKGDWSTRTEVTGPGGAPVRTQDVSVTEAVKERLGDAFEDAVASATAADD